MDLKEPLIKANRVLKYSITYQEITEESREYGEISDSGFIIENETDEIGNLLKLAVETYGIYYPVAFGWWESTYPVQNRDYFEKGIEIYYALHITNEDGTDITENESDFITFLLSDGNYNKDEFTEYAIGGIVAGAIALGIGGLIAYYYFNKGKKGYPTGRAWTKEHYNDNDDEDYEVSPNERNIKHKARNRQYVNGGGVDSFENNVDYINWQGDNYIEDGGLEMEEERYSIIKKYIDFDTINGMVDFDDNINNSLSKSNNYDETIITANLSFYKCEKLVAKLKSFISYNESNDEGLAKETIFFDNDDFVNIQYTYGNTYTGFDPKRVYEKRLKNELQGKKFDNGGGVGNSEIKIATLYGKMLNELAKEKQFNKKLEKKGLLDNFSKSNGITIDNNNIIYVNGVKVAFIDKINQKTGQEKSNWEIKKYDNGGRVKKMYYHIIEYGDYGNIGYQGYYETKEEAQKQVDKLSDYFPNQTFQIFVDNSKKEPPITTMNNGGGVGEQNNEYWERRENLEMFLNLNDEDIYWKWVNGELTDLMAVELIREIHGVNFDATKKYDNGGGVNEKENNRYWKPINEQTLSFYNLTQNSSLQEIDYDDTFLNGKVWIAFRKLPNEVTQIPYEVKMLIKEDFEYYSYGENGSFIKVSLMEGSWFSMYIKFENLTFKHLEEMLLQLPLQVEERLEDKNIKGYGELGFYDYGQSIELEISNTFSKANGGGVENAEMPTRERTTITKPTTTPTTTPSKPDEKNPYKPKHIPKPKARK